MIETKEFALIALKAQLLDSIISESFADFEQIKTIRESIENSGHLESSEIEKRLSTIDRLKNIHSKAMSSWAVVRDFDDITVNKES